MTEYLAELGRGEVAGVYEPHDECTRCKWFDVCRPAATPWNGAEMRYRQANGFRNKLVHCDAYQELFETMKSYIDSSGFADVAFGGRPRAKPTDVLAPIN
jgi:sulfatase maturation enzyme AslB (radical SAM superfamily)